MNSTDKGNKKQTTSPSKPRLSKPVNFTGHFEVFLQVNPDGSYKIETGFKNIQNDLLTDLMSMAIIRNVSEMYVDEYNNAITEYIDKEEEHEKLKAVLEDKHMIALMNDLMESMNDRFLNFMISLAEKEIENSKKVSLLPGNLKLIK